MPGVTQRTGTMAFHVNQSGLEALTIGAVLGAGVIALLVIMLARLMRILATTAFGILCLGVFIDGAEGTARWAGYAIWRLLMQGPYVQGLVWGSFLAAAAFIARRWKKGKRR